MPAQTVPVQDGNQQVGKHYLKLDPREGFCVTTKRDGDMNIPEVPSGYKGAPACSSGNAVSGISQAYAEKHRDDPGKHYYLAHDKEGNYCVVEMPRKALGNVDVPKDSFHRCWFPKHSEITQPQGGGEMARPKFVVQGLPYQLKLGQT
jgi:hypothetical protein